MENKIDWSNLDLKNKNIAELYFLHRMSYHRYFWGKIGQMSGFIFSTISLGLFLMILLIYLYVDTTKLYLRNLFLLEGILLVVGLGSLFLKRYAKKNSDKRWDEMEVIRKQITQEIKLRDEKVKNYDELMAKQG